MASTESTAVVQSADSRRAGIYSEQLPRCTVLSMEELSLESHSQLPTLPLPGVMSYFRLKGPELPQAQPTADSVK